MLLRRILIVCGLAVALPMAASAARIVFCTTCDPTLINLTVANLNSNIQLPNNGSGAVSAEFINQTGSILDNFVFSTAINKGLTASTEILNGNVVYGDPAASNVIDQNFNCQQVDSTGSTVAGYFQNCSVTYDSASGLLSFDFFGVNPPEILPEPFASEINEQEGIPSCNIGQANCQFLRSIDSSLGPGIFTIQLSGWTPNLSVGDPPGCTNSLPFLYCGTPSITGNFNVPEPSTLLIFLTEFLLLAGCVKLFGRRLHWRRRLDL